MPHREIDARELRCPFIPGIETCLTKACMAWRWTEPAVSHEQLRIIPVDRTLDRAIFEASLVEDRKNMQKRGYKLSRPAAAGEVLEQWRKINGDEREGTCARVEPQT